MGTKHERGQYFTEETSVLNRVPIPFCKNDDVVEPFAGDGHISRWLVGKCKTVVEFDKFPKHRHITKRDTLLSPPDYSGKFVVTNPPYVAKSRLAGENKVFEKYNVDDLYKAFMMTLHGCRGGIVILPANFLFGIRKSDVDLRGAFFRKFKVLGLEIMEYAFKDTAITTVVISFISTNVLDKQNIKANVSGKSIVLHVSEKNHWLHGGELYNLETSPKVKRLTAPVKTSMVVISAVDNSRKIHMRPWKNDNHWLGNQKGFATLSVPVCKKDVEKVCKDFNTYLDKQRKKYNDMFLSSFYERSRKYITLNLVYRILHVVI